MPNWIAKLKPSPWLLPKLLMLTLLVGVGAAAFCWGRWQQAGANQVEKKGEFGASPNDFLADGERAVAYIYNDVPVYRKELGEYLIQRFGSDRLEFMINRKIVELECQKHNVVASDKEVEIRFQKELQSFGQNITQDEFVNSILRRFGKTLFEWKEDVIRPKIMMEKLVMAGVKIDDSDLREGYDVKYGPRVECRMIVVEKERPAHATKVWENARKGTVSFLKEAREQYLTDLAKHEGKIPPIHKHFGDKDLEDTAFRLKEGEVGPLMKMKDGSFVILMCEKHLPANLAVRFEDVRTELMKEMFELRVAQRIPEAFAELRKRANPRLKLDNTGRASSQVLAAALPQVKEPTAPPVKIEIPPAPVPQPVIPKDSNIAPLPDAPTPIPAVTLPKTAVPVPTPPAAKK